MTKSSSIWNALPEKSRQAASSERRDTQARGPHIFFHLVWDVKRKDVKMSGSMKTIPSTVWTTGASSMSRLNMWPTLGQKKQRPAAPYCLSLPGERDTKPLIRNSHSNFLHDKKDCTANEIKIWNNEWEQKYGCLEENFWTYGPSEPKTNIFWHVLKEKREKEESKVRSKHFWVTQRSVQRSHLDSLLKPLVKSQRHVVLLLQTCQHRIHLGADGIYINIQLTHHSEELLHTAENTKTCGSIYM